VPLYKNKKSEGDFSTKDFEKTLNSHTGKRPLEVILGDRSKIRKGELCIFGDLLTKIGDK